jgi:signal transduction histidine kinase
MDQVRSSKVTGISRLAALLEEHRNDLRAFFAQEHRTEQVFAYIKTLSQHLSSEHKTILDELGGLTRNIEHIKEIVAMQQNYAKVSGVVELYSAPTLVEDALRIHASGLQRHQVEVVRTFEEVPDVLLDKHKVLQILVNLIGNAKYALSEATPGRRRLTLGVQTEPDNLIRISVADTGVGIAADNLTRIFSHGFTTRKNGHGFGLHSGFLAAREMGGALMVHSEGLGRGATFTLELPLNPNKNHES